MSEGEFTARDLENAQKLEEEIRKHHMSPPEVLKLPATLEAARQKHALPDCMFLLQAAFQTVFIKQAAPMEMEPGKASYIGSLIQIPGNSRDAAKQSCPRGVLVSAGLGALDCLRSNGIELGDMVFFVKHGPPVVRVGRVLHEEQVLYSLHVAEIRASEEAMERQKSGLMKVAVTEVEKDGVVQREHVYESEGIKQAPVGPGEEPILFE